MRFALVIACFAAFRGAAQTPEGSQVVVHVVNSVTGASIAGANVALSRENASDVQGRTDAEGVFRGRTHSAGSHLLTVSRRGYRMTGEGMGQIVAIRPGKEPDFTVRLRPLGVLAGRVLDQYGDPLRHALVHVEDKVSAPGSNDYYQSYSAATTDDLGEYRMTEVEPGRHFVAFEYSSVDEERSSHRPSQYTWPQSGGLILYPGAISIEQAQQIEVSAGMVSRLGDVRLPVRRAVFIGGRIKPPPGSAGQSLSLERTAKLALHPSPLAQGANSEPDGSFSIAALPGNYVLQASDPGSGKMSKAIALEVGDKNIDGLVLELNSGYEIRGRIAVEGRESPDTSKVKLNFGGPQVKIDGNGIFSTNVFGSEVTYMLTGLPEGWYVRSFTVAGKAISGRHFEIEPGTTQLTFTVDSRGASVSIRLEGVARGPEAVYVVLLPENGAAPDPESSLAAEPDASGLFSVRGVPPGKYRIFTLDASNWTLLMRPDLLLDKYRKLAPLIGVAEGERKEIAIPVLKITPE